MTYSICSAGKKLDFKNMLEIMNPVTSKQICCLKSYMSNGPLLFVHSVVKVDIEVFTIIRVTWR